MKITDAETFIFSAAHHNANRNWVIVKINTDDGLYGLGDASGLGNDHQVISLIDEMAEAFLIGRDPMDSEAIWTQIYYNNQSRGGRIDTTALSGIDIALWDLKGKALGLPVYKLLGGAQREKVRVYANGWYTNPGSPELNAEEALSLIHI